MDFLRKADEGKPAFGWYLLGSLIILFLWQGLGTAPLLAYCAYFAFKNDIGPEQMLSSLASMDFSTIGCNANMSYFLILIGFPLGWLGVWTSAKWLHQRPFITFITAASKFRWKHFFVSFSLWLTLTTIAELIMYLLYPDNYYFSFEANKFIPTAIISLIMIPIQSSFEELLMRGYLMQGLFRFLRIPIIPLLLSGLIFGLLHSFNPEVGAYGFWKAMPFYVAFGLFAGLITLLSDGLEMSMGMHIANNLYASLFVSFPSSVLQTNTLFAQKSLDVDAANLLALAAYIISMLVFMYLYKWRNLARLFKVIPKPLDLPPINTAKE